MVGPEIAVLVLPSSAFFWRAGSTCLFTQSNAPREGCGLSWVSWSKSNTKRRGAVGQGFETDEIGEDDFCRPVVFCDNRSALLSIQEEAAMSGHLANKAALGAAVACQRPRRRSRGFGRTARTR